MSERRARERKLRRQNEQLDEFASAVSHDLRNPLNVVQGHLTLAKQGRIVSDPKPVHLTSVTEEAWAEVETASVTLSLEEDLGRIDADRTRLRELFANLFRNAAEHGSTSSRTQSGDSVEYGSTSSRPMADDSVEHGGENGTVTVGSLEAGFLIADDGPGIAAADREAVSEHGFTTSADGTGFGLAIVETIAEAHGWTVSVAESESGGARFDIEK